MLSCKDVVALVASDAWRDPPVFRRLAVLVHLAMCRHCRAYVRQLRRLGDAARRLFDNTRSASDLTTRMTTLVRQAATRAQSGQSAGPP